MLKLVRCRDRVALSDHAFEYIKNTACRSEGGWILIVPEQFSFEAEMRLCRIGGDTIGRYAEVLSFTRLSDRVAADQGGIAGEYLDKGGQLLAMALAAEQVASRIKLYGSVLRKPEFLMDVVRMINEFRSYCLTPETLFDAAQKSTGQFSQKIEELGILYEAYLSVCANGKADPSDKLTRLLASAADCRWIREKRIYVDGFSDFTGAELKVLELLMCCAEEIIISLPTGEDGSAAYRVGEKTADDLKKIAQREFIDCMEEDINIETRRDDAVQSLLKHLFTYADDTQFSASDSVKLLCCASVEEECRMATKIVMDLLMKGARCRDISVACTDMSCYEVPLTSAFRTAGLSAYYAGERNLLSQSIATGLVNTLFAACGAMDYEDMLLYLRSELHNGTREQCDRLDSYAYLWNVKGSGWSAEWKLHPRGFGEQMTDEDLAYLACLNEDRKNVLDPILTLRRKLLKADNTGQMVLALYDFTEEIGLRQKLEEKAAEYELEGKGQAAQELAQIYELLIQSMEQTWFTLGETTRSAEDFCRLYQCVLTQYKVATIPVGVDQIHVSDVPDLRYRRAKHLIVLGASDGCFPAYRTTEGLLTEDERRLLASQGISIAPGKADCLDQELSRISFALASATDSVTLTYSGEQPSWLFRRAAAIYPDSFCVADAGVVLDPWEFAAHRLRSCDTSVCCAEEVCRIEQQLKKLREYSFHPLDRETVQSLYGSPITLSPSKIDRYASCKFAFFMNYGLKVKPRKRAKLDQPAFGTFVHAVLEKTVMRVNAAGGFHVVGETEILDIAAEEISNYAEECFPEQAKRGEYLFERSKSEIRQIVLDLWEELRKSKFEPEFCELKFSGGEELPAVHISGAQANCKVVGMVDRVDIYRDGETAYVRVVDYKTGFKEFDYTDILYGAGLQMLIYLFALQTSGERLIGAKHIEPAGVLYMPAKKDYPLMEAMPDDCLVSEKHRQLRRRKGLIRCESRLLAAMEENPETPLFMPYKVGKNGLSGDLADSRQMRMLERHVTRTIASMADSIEDGAVTPDPVVRGQHNSCKYCDYKTICHKDMGMLEERIFAETSAAKFWEKLEQEESNHV